MVGFFLSFSQRVLSGVMSYFGYKKNRIGLVIASVFLLLFPVLASFDNWLYLLFAIVNIITVGMKMISFGDDMLPSLKKYKDIHFWENLVTGGFFLYLTLSGYNFLMLLCSVYPALILHKGLINLGSKLSFFDEATDDETGKTYSIPLLGIKIKRSTTKTRLIFAGVSILALLLIHILHIDVHFYLLK